MLSFPLVYGGIAGYVSPRIMGASQVMFPRDLEVLKKTSSCHTAAHQSPSAEPTARLIGQLSNFDTGWIPLTKDNAQSDQIQAIREETDHQNCVKKER
jgi:hypothetical protein